MAAVGNTHELSDDDRRKLWEQFVEVYAKSQESYDSSVRTLGAAGVGVTVSLATALGSIATTGVAAIALFLASLGLGVASHVTAQVDMTFRLGRLRDKRTDGIDRNHWSWTTWSLNTAAGIALITGAILLALYIADRTGAHIARG